MLTGRRQMPEEFFAWQQRYSLERTDEGRLLCLQHMLEYIPVGYFEFNNVRSHVTQQMRFIRERINHRIHQQEGIEKSRMAFKTELFTIVLVGEPNSGKTHLLNELCLTSHPSTPIPFETKSPIVGTFKHSDATIRVVEVPSAINKRQLRVLNESDLIIIMPDGKRFVDFIQSNGVEVPFRMLAKYPDDLWDFLGLIVVRSYDEPIVLFEGTKLSDLRLNSGIVNGVKKGSDYVLEDEDVLE